MSKKDLYTLFCEGKTNIPFFSYPWWLEIVCNGEWDAIIMEKNNEIIAALPYYYNRTTNSIEQPVITQNNGIIMDYPKDLTILKKQKYEERVINFFCEELNKMKLNSFCQQFHYRYDNWLPFFWNDYSEITRYTYVVDTTKGYNEIYLNYSVNVRNSLRKAKKHLRVKESDDVSKFYEVYSKTFERQNMNPPISQKELLGMYSGCEKHNCGKMLFAVDINDVVHSVAMIVWDDSSIYYLLNGTDPLLKSYQGNTLLIDEGIKNAIEMGKLFDFEGSVIPGVNKAFRQYGGEPMRYFRIFKLFE